MLAASEQNADVSGTFLLHLRSFQTAHTGPQGDGALNFRADGALGQIWGVIDEAEIVARSLELWLESSSSQLHSKSQYWAFFPGRGGVQCARKHQHQCLAYFDSPIEMTTYESLAAPLPFKWREMILCLANMAGNGEVRARYLLIFQGHVRHLPAIRIVGGAVHNLAIEV
jgi:hypothetical protein